jgi:hypothetical protein
MASPSSLSPSKKTLSVTLNPQLVDRVLAATTDLDGAIEAGLALWLDQATDAEKATDSAAIAPIQTAPSKSRPLNLSPAPSDHHGENDGDRALALRKPARRPNMPTSDGIPANRRIQGLPIDKRRTSNDDETGWLI